MDQLFEFHNDLQINESYTNDDCHSVGYEGEETDTTEDESVVSDDSDEETETKQGNPYSRFSEFLVKKNTKTFQEIVYTLPKGCGD